MTVEQVKEAMRNGNAALADGHVWMQASHELRVEAEREVERLKAATQALSDERNMLQRVIDKAYDNACEFEDDPQIALRCVLEGIAPHVEAGSDETPPTAPEQGGS